MKSIMLLVFACWCVNALAQEKGKAGTPVKPMVNDSFYTGGKHYNAPANSRRDTFKLVIPKEKKFNPTNAKLKNSKIKTPVYNSTLTGTNAPGDVNTGLSVDNTSHHVEVNPTQQRVKEIKDSLARSPRPN